MSLCSAQKRIAGNYSYETECLGVELDGTQILKAWGYGSNKPIAIEQAKKNAIKDVLFKGIRNGKSDCSMKPVVLETNALENHEDYFNKFFSDGGDYLNFISQKDESKPKNIDKKNARTGIEIGVVVGVLISDLKKKMIQDNIIIK